MPIGESVSDIRVVRKRVYDNPRPMRTNLRTVRNARVTDETHLADPNVDPIIKVLIRLRLENNVSAEGMERRASLAGTPISSTAFRKWERNASSPSLFYLRRWCRLLGKNLEQICAELGQS